MGRSRSRLLIALLLTASAACASASDRFNDGLELQSEGRWMEAAYRYAEAVEKDGAMQEARDRLSVAGDSAIQISMRAAGDFWSREQPIEAADEFRAADRLIARVLEVGMRLETPQEYGDLRRESFEWAIDAWMSRGTERWEVGEFGEARAAFLRARSDYEANRAQQNASLDAETDLLLAWAEALLVDDRYQASFDRAAEALALRPGTRPAVVEAVQAMQAEALRLGTVRVAVLPVSSVPAVREEVGEGFANRLGDDLELDHWREPPPFVTVVDPVRVRRETRDATRGAVELTPSVLRRILSRVEGEFAALIEVSTVSVTEENARTSGREARTTDGRTTSYEVVTGQLVYRAEVSVVLVGPEGREFDSWNTSGRKTGRFERGLYRGDVAELELGRNEARLFNDDVLAAQREEVEVDVLAEVAERVAGRVFSRVLARVR